MEASTGSGALPRPPDAGAAMLRVHTAEDPDKRSQRGCDAVATAALQSGAVAGKAVLTINNTPAA